MDGISAILWFRVDTNVPLKWPTGPGKDIEFIHFGQRYGVVRPSIHPDTKEPYEWYDQSWLLCDPPEIDELAELPMEWVMRFTGGEYYDGSEPIEPATSEQVSQCLTDGEMCQAALKPVQEYANSGGSGSRHDAMTKTIMKLVRLGEQGHHGAAQGVDAVRALFPLFVGSDRSPAELYGTMDHPSEIDRAIDGAVAKVLAAPTPEESKRCCGSGQQSDGRPPSSATLLGGGGQRQQDQQSGDPQPSGDHTGLTLPVSFYESRPELKEIREYAHRWGAPADPVLYAILTRISATVPPGQRVQTGILSPIGASLNLFVAAVGPSGSCKSSSASIARPYFQPGVLNMLDGLGLGSGEGLAEAYMGWVEIDAGELNKNGTPKTKKIKQQIRENIFIVVDEGEALTKKMAQDTNVVGPTIRSAADGKTLGQANADENRNRHIAEGRYSLGMLVGFQPETVVPLFADSAAGTPQRFVYCFTTADDIPEDPAGQLIADVPQLMTFPGVRMDMTQEIKAEIYRDHIAHMRGVVDEDRMDARRNLTKAKLAGLLTLLNDSTRQIVGQEEWDLAEIMWQTSCNVRDYYRAEAKAADRTRRDQADAQYAVREGKAEAAREAARDGYVPKAVIRCAKLIAKHVHDGNVSTANQAEQKLASRDRHLFDDAMEYAESVLWVRVDGTQVSTGQSRPT
jgi:hypothetical protein